ncbi:MAG TPA: MFS transporter, partial [Symbiobacteriaceae bacterium]|nr:MFS transporter [Symbiobacteriaceae bacterium]
WSLVAGVVNVSAFFWQPEPPYVRRPPESPMLHLTLPFRSTSFLWAIGFATAVTIASALVLPFYGVAMIKTMHLSYSLIARLMVVATVSGIVANLTLARLLDRLGLHRVLGALPALLALTPLLWLAIGPQSFALLYLAHVLQGAGVAMQLLVLSNLNFGMSPRADRPIYLAVFSSLSGLGGFVAPIVGGWVLGRFGFTVLLWSAMGCCVAAALLWQWRARAHVVETLGAQSEE